MLSNKDCSRHSISLSLHIAQIQETPAGKVAAAVIGLKEFQTATKVSKDIPEAESAINETVHMMEQGKGKKGTTNFDGKYEPNPKHDVKRSGVSPQPTNPEKTLSSSVPVSVNGPARSSFDSEAGEIVVFRMHPEGVYHGYVKNWESTTQQEKNALIKSG